MSSTINDQITAANETFATAKETAINHGRTASNGLPALS
jgi:hypothetical protein